MGFWKEAWQAQKETWRETNTESARSNAKADRLRKEAVKKDKRAEKMSKKHLRGNIRARNAAAIAENLHRQADGLEQPTDRCAQCGQSRSVRNPNCYLYSHREGR
jgi:hypothetical protein